MTPELVITRHNDLIDPSSHVWGWQIPVYLFLGGWVAGMMILTGYFLLAARHRERPLRLLDAAGSGPRAAEPRHARAVPRPGAQALRLAALHHLPADVADVVGRLDPVARLPGARVTCLVRPPVLLEDLGRASDAAHGRAARHVRTPCAPIGGANIGARRRAGHLHRHPPQLARRPAVLEQRHARRRSSSCPGFRRLRRSRTSSRASPEEREHWPRVDNVFLAIELALLALFLIGLLGGRTRRRSQRPRRSVLGGPFTAVVLGRASSGSASSCR